MANLGTTAKKKVDAEGEPSYTSGAHVWKGAIASLKSKLIKININPNLISPMSKKLISENVVLISPGDTLINKSLNSSKFMVPVTPYNNEEPNKNKLEEKAPKIKYLIPASTEYVEFFLKEAKT